MPFGPEDQLTALEAIERQGRGLTTWEEEFIESLRTLADQGRAFTAKQVETLERIYVRKAS